MPLRGGSLSSPLTYREPHIQHTHDLASSWHLKRQEERWKRLAEDAQKGWHLHRSRWSDVHGVLKASCVEDDKYWRSAMVQSQNFKNLNVCQGSNTLMVHPHRCFYLFWLIWALLRTVWACTNCFSSFSSFVAPVRVRDVTPLSFLWAHEIWWPYLTNYLPLWKKKSWMNEQTLTDFLASWGQWNKLWTQHCHNITLEVDMGNLLSRAAYLHVHYHSFGAAFLITW